MSSQAEIFFHIGYHKTGTSYLQKKIFPYLKDISYFNCTNIDAILEPDLSVKEISKRKRAVFGEIENLNKILLSRESLSGGIWIGNTDVAYKNADGLKSAFPDAKIIICLRNQTDFILSHYAFLVHRGNMWRGLDSFLDFFFEAFFVKKLKYDELIEYYQTLFDKRNVLVLLQEDLRKNPKYFFDQLSDFMKVTIDESLYRPIAEDRVNATSKNYYFLKTLCIMNFLTLGSFHLLEKSGILKDKDKSLAIRMRVVEQYVGVIGKLFAKEETNTKKIEIEEQWIQKIDEAFSASNAKTSELISRDLSEHGYVIVSSSSRSKEGFRGLALI